MMCPKCGARNTGQYFCRYCRVFMPDPARGVKTSAGRRLTAGLLDTILVWGSLIFGVPLLTAVLHDQQDSLAYYGIILVCLTICWTNGLTPAKHWLRLTILNAETSQPASFKRMLAREIPLKMLSGFCFGLGYLWALWDHDGQAWHDKLASTVVIYQPPIPVSFAQTVSAAATGHVPSSSSPEVTESSSRWP